MSHPYRTPDGSSPVASRKAATGLEAALRAAIVVVFVWSLVRVALCSFRGLDFEGFVALVIVVTAVQSLTFRSRFS